MARTHRLSTTGALIVCLVGTQFSGTLFASDEEPVVAAVPVGQELAGAADPSPRPLPTMQPFRFTISDELLTANAPVGPASARSARTSVPDESSSFAQWGRRRGRRGGNGAAQAELVIGAVASIAGAALLVYANRPECSTNQMANGCGYGAKVVGGAVLSAGILSIVIGAVTWR